MSNASYSNMVHMIEIHFGQWCSTNVVECFTSLDKYNFLFHLEDHSISVHSYCEMSSRHMVLHINWIRDTVGCKLVIYHCLWSPIHNMDQIHNALTVVNIHLNISVLCNQDFDIYHNVIYAS